MVAGYRALIERAAVRLSVTTFAGIRVERHSRDNAESFIAAVGG